MHTLDERQVAELRKLHQLAATAAIELDDSFSSGMMSDSKSAVYAVMSAADAADLPEEIVLPLRQMARESWHGAVSLGEVYARAGKAIAAIGNIQRQIESICAAHGIRMDGA